MSASLCWRWCSLWNRPVLVLRCVGVLDGMFMGRSRAEALEGLEGINARRLELGLAPIVLAVM